MIFDQDDALDRCQLAQGWVRPKERLKLYYLAHSTPSEGVIVEIGSWKGRSTIILACASKHSGKREVYAVDPFGKPEKMQVKHEYDLWNQQKEYDTFNDFLKNIKAANVQDIVIPIRAMSEDAIHIYKQKFNYPIRFLFIDGCHQRKFAQQDFDLWSPHVMVGGVVAFHDAWANNKDFNESPAIVAKQELIDSPNYHNGQCQSLIYGTKIR
jgi:predicted O-methyltransferase YrrM